jgi:murein L,D-transpeptidase YcbB/YkuD
MRKIVGFATLLAGALVGTSTTAQSVHWSREDVRELAQSIELTGTNGLEQSRYGLDALDLALVTGDPARIDATASASFQKVAMDYWQGRVRKVGRKGWHIVGPVADAPALAELQTAALTTHSVRTALTELLPTNPEYARLKIALAATSLTDNAKRRLLLANMERWRWLPRDPGRRYVLVNVASFTAELVTDGLVVAVHRIVIGKLSTPTPQFSTAITGVILNPWWEVPPSIAAESGNALMRNHPSRAREQGFVSVRLPGGGTRMRQGPGPLNALGQMKLVMPNPYTVYLHDTPSKALFDKAIRAFSHGCMRVDLPLNLVSELMSETPGWDRARVDSVVATKKTATVALAIPVPIYVVYLTARAAADGSIITYPDVYGRDAAVVAALAIR